MKDSHTHSGERMLKKVVQELLENFSDHVILRYEDCISVKNSVSHGFYRSYGGVTVDVSPFENKRKENLNKPILVYYNADKRSENFQIPRQIMYCSSVIFLYSKSSKKIKFLKSRNARDIYFKSFKSLNFTLLGSDKVIEIPSNAEDFIMRIL